MPKIIYKGQELNIPDGHSCYSITRPSVYCEGYKKPATCWLFSAPLNGQHERCQDCKDTEVKE